MSDDSDGIRRVRHREVCGFCRSEYDVFAWREHPHIRATCVRCNANRQYIDKQTFEKGLSVVTDVDRGKRPRQTQSQRDSTMRIADGRCVHCILEAVGIRPKSRIAIPADWKAPVPTIQLEIFHDALALAPTVDLSAIAAGREGDHILQVQLHDRLASDWTSDQLDYARRFWLVPSCEVHNRRRANHLEALPYLVHLIAFVIDARKVTTADQANEVQSFVDAAKIAHAHLTAEIAFRKRAIAQRRGLQSE